MSLIGNILWIFLGGGFLIWLEYALVGILCCLTIVGIPFGMQCFKLARVGLLPFGTVIETSGESFRPLALVGNFLWTCTFGLTIATTHLLLGVYLCLTLIGLPFGLQHFKLAWLALFPFGRSF